MGQVQRLPAEVTRYIAAGEVVARPASVVKELLENALDAGAQRVTVHVQGGGTALLQVDDDGCGMDAEDAVRCFERHATSKIRSVEDLSRLTTFGFRGEALASIAAVAHVELTTRRPQDVIGTRVRVAAGQVQQVEACGAPPGTSVRVTDLFANTPARRKFLKNAATETGHLTHCVTALALAAPHLHLTLLRDGRPQLQVPPAADLGTRLDLLFGVGFQDQLLPVAERSGPWQVQGFIGKPTVHRATRRQQFFFVNGRLVQSRLLSQALYEAYRTLLPRERHPLAFLLLAVEPSEVDVNVHPAKLEVRFRQEAHLYDFLRRLLQRRLQESAPPPVATSSAAPAAPAPMLWRPAAPAPEAPVAAALAADYPAAGQALLEGQPVGQLHETYIVVQYPGGVGFVDQHAAHERVVYERLCASLQAGDLPSQTLLFPLTLELDRHEAACLQRSLPRLARLGFELQPFGPRTFRLCSVPTLLVARDPAAALRDLLELLQVPEEDAPDAPGNGLTRRLEGLLTVLACHGALRAGQRLHEPDMRALLQELAQTRMPFTCPHGRPVLLNVALTDLERRFLRR
ncbi:MAG: hypothetical protein KatS3mg131_0784 [Candidatus Tectimicrobiota bacterium]|nr:MAG: hypothetical protein KatS3mg131_0784 [Candidatus Tectomicrobia bacterium]